MGKKIYSPCANCGKNLTEEEMLSGAEICEDCKTYIDQDDGMTQPSDSTFEDDENPMDSEYPDGKELDFN